MPILYPDLSARLLHVVYQRCAVQRNPKIHSLIAAIVAMLPEWSFPRDGEVDVFLISFKCCDAVVVVSHFVTQKKSITHT